jgi:hypothetical protein
LNGKKPDRRHIVITVTASLKTGKIISIVDNGPRPGDDQWVKPIAKIIASQIRRESK